MNVGELKAILAGFEDFKEVTVGGSEVYGVVEKRSVVKEGRIFSDIDPHIDIICALSNEVFGLKQENQELDWEIHEVYRDKDEIIMNMKSFAKELIDMARQVEDNLA